MAKIIRYLTITQKDCVIYAPESFEYLLLKSGIIYTPSEICDQTYKYADTKNYLSWEEYYTSYLIKITRGSIYQYSKSNLKETYKTEGSLKKVINIMPEEIRP